MLYQKILNDFASIPNIKTRDLDNYNKELIKAKVDVSDLKLYVIEYPLLHRTYFQVSMLYKETYREQFEYIEQNLDLLQDWWHVDQLTQFIYRPVDFDYAYKLALRYTNDQATFTRRWGYVLFLVGLQKDEATLGLIWKLLKDDPEYYVQMAQAWLICDLAVFNPELTLEYLEKSHLNYNILGKAIQKINDSFRISDEIKVRAKALRPILKLNS
jgi:3-methyladenine DNA glycosylase AlkD